MIARLLIAAFAAALIAVGAWGGLHIDGRSPLGGCGSARAAERVCATTAGGRIAARINTITNDKESDNAVDSITDLRAVPNSWMRAEAP